jgi:hypothetical protein
VDARRHSRLTPRARDAIPAALLLLVLAACSSTPAQTGARPIALGESPTEFHGMRSTLLRLVRHREAGDAAGARAMHAAVLDASRELLKMGPPHDLPRQRYPRFLEGRGSFGDAVNQFDRAARDADDAALWRAATDLEATFSAWYDAYRGRPSEGSV